MQSKRKLRSGLFLCCLVCLSNLSYADSRIAQKTSLRFIHSTHTSVILPAIDKFVVSLESLRDTLPDCDASVTSASALRVEEFKHQWSVAARRWQHVMVFRVGATKHNDMDLKISHRPVRKSKIRALFVEENPLDADALLSYSIAGRGLYALEYLLFDETGRELLFASPRKGCQVLQSLSERLIQDANYVQARWATDENAILTMLSPDKKDTVEGTQKLVAAISSSTSNIKHMLGRVLGVATELIKPHAAPYWRSRQSLTMLTETVDGLRSLVGSETGAVLKNLLEQTNGTDGVRAHQRMLNVLNNLDTQIQSLEEPLFEAVVTDIDAVRKLYHQAVLLESVMRQDIAVLLGTQIGFTSADGD